MKNDKRIIYGEYIQENKVKGFEIYNKKEQKLQVQKTLFGFEEL